ncbi:MAG: protein kinase domain-containing protein [Candidatus Promineifilaceae bacterium]
MNRICLLCERTSVNENLYCQEDYCPAELSPTILGYGEWIGDIEIIQAVSILRSAVIYEASHQKEKVFLKIAQPGQMHINKLKREAEFLRDLKQSKNQHACLPKLLPPYVSTNVATDAYGKGMRGGQLIYFYLFTFSEGNTLRDLLRKRPQLWLNHIGWLVISLARTIEFLHEQGMYHCAIMPDAVLVRFDDKPEVPRILLLDLGVAASQSVMSNDWDPSFVLPAYTAPELRLDILRPNSATDVYGLGLTMYEMLIGQPVYTYSLLKDEAVYRAVERNRQAVMTRVDIQSVAKIAVQAVNQTPSQRQKKPAVLIQQLIEQFGEIPTPTPSRWPTTETMQIFVGGLLLIAILILLLFTASDLVTDLLAVVP